MICTAQQVAFELRRLADSLDSNPTAKITKAHLLFSSDEKESFLNLVRVMPKPFRKSMDVGGEERYRRIKVEYDSNAIWIMASVRRDLTCELLEPAKPAVYRCEPILSEEEDAEVVA